MNLPLIARAEEHNENIAIVTTEGAFTYRDLLHTSSQIAISLLQNAEDLQEQRVAFLIPPGFEYAATQWGIWRAGGIAVPLCISHPRPELEYVITHSGASTLVAHPNFEGILRPIAESQNLRFLLTSELLLSDAGRLPEVDISRRALILYTSGTTGKPKGVVTTHDNIQSQVKSLIVAWGWTSSDRILHVLPLHHIHGIINVLTCALWAGAECHIPSKFDADIVWDRISQGDLTLFMAVPTIYVKLIAAWEAASSDKPGTACAKGERQKTMSEGCAKMRLMVSGSAALPVQVLEKWKTISNHFLLERYGMTEIGMALSNPLHGQRYAGYVGTPLPQVEVRLVDESGELVPPGTPGEIQVKGPGVFLEYWQNPEATAKAFRDGWFLTGDLAVVENGNYRILGRMSVDIIKTGGYKVSALEIEEVLRTHPDIQECAVVGIKDPEWGERVCAALVLQQSERLTLETFRSWAKERLAVYKVPTRILSVEELPRNAMGKVTKPAVAQLFT
ncbi:AMP-binding protein [Scytonema sp. UIC 10036]|uniref:acyl-CoA synthetase n=1 Tax=Scytonema sp. UIC 10036 TaxID=2304196 RepID=UPI0012DA444C|nr:acyl-CoA synthetase [Scytonema sp. UIC 10036]MUG97641.1 AMP-binding protein [Scytonema sp. UIC 10036]